MGTIYSSDPSELIEKASEELKKVESIKAPSWSIMVKTGMHKERPPTNNDWWHTRTASILRQVYIKGPIGVSKLRNKYGGKKNRGMKKSHFYKGSGSIIRKIMQQLEAAGFVKKEEKAVHRGKLVTKEGKQFLDKIASTISVEVKTPKKEVKPAKEKAAKEETKPVKEKQEKKKEIVQETKTEIKEEAKPKEAIKKETQPQKQ
jgi:small subunit ribosomal protein S19e|tara:strand:- start:1497 stop:2105 length:609 start_codon:yes stop_codon:yes gene_type:complete